MAENEIPMGSANLGGPWAVPPTQAVTQFALAMTLNEVVVTFGISRASIQPGPGGAVTPVLGSEWLVSLSIPPTLAKSMQENIAKAIERYEELFGKIPVDPGAKVVINDALRPSG
jgi:hypothetical protein